jgi:hypothetical protein
MTFFEVVSPCDGVKFRNMADFRISGLNFCVNRGMVQLDTNKKPRPENRRPLLHFVSLRARSPKLAP